MPNIKLNIVTQTNLQAIDQLKSKLQEVKAIATSDFMSGAGFSAAEVHKTVTAVNTLEKALTAAYDKKLSTVNIKKFNNYLAKSKITTQDLYKDLSRVGIEGQKAFLNMTQASLSMGQSIKQTSAFVDEMKTTLMNTVRWGISSGLWNTMTSTVSKAYGYIKNLNTDLNDIRVVTGKSANEMERFAKTANNAAKNLGVSTRDYTQGALLYYQQGDDDKTVEKKTEITAKAANVTGQGTDTVSEQLTAVWNGYQVANEAAKEGMDVYEEYIDKLAAVAATTASDLEEQATAMSKVASAASSMGVGFDDLNAQIATIVSVTRQSPESVGTALKTIYARLGDLKIDGVDEFGVKLGEVSGELKTVGIDVLDANDNMRDMSDVMADVAAKWGTWTDAQKQAAAVSMAGKRQYNNLIALFDNMGMYNNALNTSMKASGTLAEQQAIKMDSLEKKTKKLSTTIESFYSALINKDSIGGLLDGLTSVLAVVTSIVDSVGGLSTLLPIVGGMLVKSLGSNLGDMMARKKQNKDLENAELSNDDAKKQMSKEISKAGEVFEKDGSNNALIKQEQDSMIAYYQDMLKYRKNMTEEEIAAYNQLLERQSVLSQTKLETQKDIELLGQKYGLEAESLEVLQTANQYRAELAKTQEKTVKKWEQQKELTESEKNVLFNILQSSQDLEEVDKKILNRMKEKKTFNDDDRNYINEMLEKSTLLQQVDDERLEKMKSDARELLAVYEDIKESAITEDLTGYDDASAIKEDNASYQEDMDKAAKDISSFTNSKFYGQDTSFDVQAVDDSLINYMKKAAEEGMSAEEAIKKVNRQFETLTGKKLNDKELKKFTKSYVKMQSSVTKYNEKLAKDFDDTIGKALQKSLGPDSEKVFGKLKNKIIELQKQGKPLKQAYSEALESIKGEGEDVLKAIEQVESQIAKQEDIDFDIDAEEEIQQLKKGMQSITGFIGGATQALGGFGAMWNTLSKAADPSLSAFDRFKAIIGGCIVAIPAMVSGVHAMISATNGFTTAMGAANLAEASSIALSKAKIAIMKVVAFLTGTHITAEQAKAAATMFAEGATWGEVTATLALETALFPIPLILLAIVAAFAAFIAVAVVVTTIIGEVNQGYIDQANDAQTLYEAKKKLVDAAREEKEAMESIVDTYKALKAQYEDGSISLDELRAKTAEICKEYEKQDLALRALIADGKELNKIEQDLEKARDEADNDFIEKSEAAIEANKDTIKKRMYSEGDSSMTDTVDGKQVLDIVDGASQYLKNDEEEKIQDLLQKYNVDISNGYADLDSFTNAIGKNYDEIYSGLSNIDDNIAEELLEVMDSVKDNVDELQAAVEETQNAHKDLVVRQNVGQDIETYEEYAKVLNKMADEVKDYFDSPEEAKVWAESQLYGEQKHLNMTMVYDISKKTQAKTDADAVDIAKELEGMDDDDLTFITKFLDMKDVDETFDEFLKKYEGLKDMLSRESIAATIDVILNTEGLEELSDAQVDSLFGTEDFEKIMNISKEQFEGLDFETQRLLMSQYYLDQQKYIDENKDQIVASLQEEADALINAETYQGKNKNEFQENGQDPIKKKYSDNDDIKDMLEETGKSFEDLDTIAEKFAVEGIDALTDSEKSILEKMQSFKDDSGEQLFSNEYLKNIGTAISLNKSYNAAVASSTEAVEKAQNAEADYEGALKAIRNRYPEISKGIDNIQTGFSDLTSIVEDFNDNGTLSLDSLQTLLSLSDEMLACLEIENGQMTINASKVKELAMNRLQEAKAAIWNETQTYLLILAKKKVASAEEEAAIKAILLKESVEKGAEAALESAAAWAAYNAEVAGVDIDLVNHDEKIQQFLENQRKKMVGLESAMEGLSEYDLTTISGEDRDEELKFFDDEFDRYWKLNKIIDKTSQAIDKLADVQDGLFRQELLDNIDSTNKALEQQIQNYDNLAKAQQREVSELQSSLSGYGISFDAKGGIANYAEAAQNALNYYNGVVESYNRGFVNDSGLEAAEESYDKFKEQLERYDELYYDEMVDTAEQIAEKQAEILGNNLKKFELKLEIKTNAQDFEREINDFFAEINTDFKSSFEDVGASIEKAKTNAISFGESFSTMSWGIEQVKKEINKLYNGQDSNIFSSLSEAQEKLKELTQEAMDYASSMRDLYEKAWDTYLDGIDQSMEKLDKAQEQYAKINEELEYQGQLIELLYGPEAYQLMGNLYEKQAANTLVNVQSLKEQEALWQQMYNSAEEGSKEQQKYGEKLEEIQSSINEGVLEYIDLIKNEYANTVDSVFKKLEKNLSGSTFADVSEEWDRLIAKSDKYFDNLERLYETQKLANKITGSINDTTSVKNQKKLQALYDKEITYLREKEELTQYDLDAANARYEIALKEMALEDAKNNKNSMKLTRDSNGNWSYQYVANQEDMAKKEQELSDSIANLYQLSNDAYKENLEALSALNEEYVNNGKEIAESDVLTQQEKEQKLAELRTWYLDEYKQLVGENELYKNDLAVASAALAKNLYDQDVLNFQSMSDSEKALITQVKELGISDFAEMQSAIEGNLNSIGETANRIANENIVLMQSKTQELANAWAADDGLSVKAQVLDAENALITAMDTLQIKTDKAAAAIGEDWGPKGIKGAIDDTTQATENAKKAVEDLCNSTKTSLDEHKATIATIESEWNKVKDSVTGAIRETQKLYKLYKNPPPASGLTIDTVGDTPDNSNFNNVKKISKNPPKENPKENPKEKSEGRVLLGSQVEMFASPEGGKKYDSPLRGGAASYEYRSPLSSYPYYIKFKNASGKVGKEGYISMEDFIVNSGGRSFDTGGYTGEWGSQGRMAMLHEKEIVLNKQDTANILSAVNSIRQISSVEDAITKGIAEMIMNLAGMGVNVNYHSQESKPEDKQQVFNVHAEFPNANSVDEIKEAILSLPGLASQQAGLSLI